MIEVLFFSFLSSFQIFISGYLFHHFLISKDIKNKNNIFELGLYGIFILCFVALLVNFFFGLSRLVNDIIFIFPIFLFLIFCFNKNIIKKIAILSFITAIFFTLTISFDNHYIPDSGSYHLPFVSILNENKIIIGLNNLHYRFGHVSIMQYISAAFNNHLFQDIGISIPLGIMYCYFVGYLVVEIFYQKNNKVSFIFLFIVLAFVLFRMNRYSALGNDGPAHIIFFYLIAESLKNYDSSHILKKTTLAATFVFMNKITLLLGFFVPLYFFIKFFKKSLILNRINIFCLFFLLLFLFKNFLISGCIAFPVEQSCVKNVSWFDKDSKRRSNAKDGRIENEAWTKSWPDQPLPQKDFATYISDFGWFEIWKKHHGIVILKKISPFVLFLSIIFLSIVFYEYKYLRKHKSQKLDLNFNHFFLISICFLGSALWFFKFPVFRYGYSYLISFFGLTVSMSIRNFHIFNKLNDIKKICFILIAILAFGVCIKHSLRIFPNLINNTGIKAWPRIYSNDLIYKKRDNIPIYKNGKLLFYKNEANQCYYSKSPCTHLFGHEFDLNDISMKSLSGYKVFYFKKK